MDETLERRIDISPGYCLIRPEPSRNYGIAACRIWFYVIGQKGAVQWQISTDWYPQKAREHLAKFPRMSDADDQPKGWDLGYHAKEARYEGQEPMECHLLDGKCYYDGSALNAEGWVEGFVNGGTEWLWPRLEQYYRSVFEGGEYPDLTPVPVKHPDDE